MRVVEVVPICNRPDHVKGCVARADYSDRSVSDGLIILKSCQIPALAEWLQGRNDSLEGFRPGGLYVNVEVKGLRNSRVEYAADARLSVPVYL